ncbi:hypothetical protein NFI96_012823 [Prochilodus magdalenae]|nr:hypothetical protein NFI96_012823 [Prochilodus magdalenae]
MAEEIQVLALEWPSQSHDLNYIEMLWHDLKLAVHARKPANITELQQFCKDEWAKIPPQHRERLIASYRKHSIAVVAAKGGPTRFGPTRFRGQTLFYTGPCVAGRAEVGVENALSREPGQLQQHRTYQWLHTQAVKTKRSSATCASDHFLPEIDPDILNGGRVQLVTGASYRESPDSAARLWSDAPDFFPPHTQHARVRRHSVGHAKKEVLSPKRVTSAPSRKERVSFRDNPVQLSGGWGGGKKRAKVNK